MIGRPIVMDNVTDTMCRNGVGRVGFARVLVEISAKKELPKQIEVVYRNNLKEEKGRKVIEVVYDWQPPRCSECCVFGHMDHQCKKHVTENKGEGENKEGEEMNKGKNTSCEQFNVKGVENGFIQVNKQGNKGMDGKTKNSNYRTHTQTQKYGNYKYGVGKDTGSRNVYVAKNVEGNKAKATDPSTSKSTEEMGNKTKAADTSILKKVDDGEKKSSGKNSPMNSAIKKKTWSINEEILEALKRSANKYPVLEVVEEVERQEVIDVYDDETGIAQSMDKEVLKGKDSGVLEDC
ncbi:hypothetical protein CTI12_AA512370 [Artemisia annua]|uniref:Zinc knuckle CX2CX4HX4C n=1 Tax=Artemisia annua TaxID=35608 RepID=A0A2U1LA33_ARTAN|nr:hypothetical protein CTI12_AA512370 [Artemisia annua]